MAESQVPYPYDASNLTAIRTAISEPRFSTYMTKAGGHEKYAFVLYLYNARVAKAFLYPLQMVEVTVRNAMDSVLVEKFGADWQSEPRFREKTLTPEGRSTLDKAIERAGNGASHGAVVASLTFDFWSNFLRPDYGDFWRTKLNRAFPNLAVGKSRHDVQTLAKAINRFRNRVAHHEPILDMNVTDIQSQIVELVELRCSITAGWMRHHSTINAVIRTRPKLDGSTASDLASKFDPEFLTVNAGTTLAEIAAQVDERHPAIACTDDAGIPIAGLTVFDITRYISEKSKAEGNMIDLDEHTVGDVLANGIAPDRWSVMDQTAPLFTAIAELRKPRTQVLLGTDPATGRVTGAMVRAHRRY